MQLNATTHNVVAIGGAVGSWAIAASSGQSGGHEYSILAHQHTVRRKKERSAIQRAAVALNHTNNAIARVDSRRRMLRGGARVSHRRQQLGDRRRRFFQLHRPPLQRATRRFLNVRIAARTSIKIEFRPPHRRRYRDPVEGWAKYVRTLES